ncbi:BLUF domain-containing protein [Croceiramulus getboli]|nr:BLUF domain-containing protein [Flavobacteriaceae bacterium YJPT1-3]
MIEINVDSAMEMLRALSVNWGGEFTEGKGISRIDLDNETGKGRVISYDVLPGLSVITYNIRFHRDVHITKDERVMNPIYFLFCLDGHFYHKYSDEAQKRKVAKMQNVILASSATKKNVATLPADVDLKISVLIVMRDRLELSDTADDKDYLLHTTIDNLYEQFNSDASYKYFGEINLSTAHHSRALIKSKRTDVVGRLQMKAAVLNTLASQLEGHDKHRDGDHKMPDLTTEELDRIVHLGDYIAENISKRLTIADLVKVTGLSSKKLQTGTRYLYGETVNHFIKNVKLEYAKDLMLTSQLSISEITYEVGISSKSYFSKIFKERFGMLPKDFYQSEETANALFELTYRSTMSSGTGDRDIKDILETSRTNNEKHDITGCLVCYQNAFFQILEGPKEAVLELYAAIEEDPRHYDVELLWKGVKVDRQFEHWRLAFVSEEGKFQVAVDGRIKHIDIEKLVSNMHEPSILSDLLWKRIRNILKVAS